MFHGERSATTYQRIGYYWISKNSGRRGKSVLSGGGGMFVLRRTGTILARKRLADDVFPFSFACNNLSTFSRNSLNAPLWCCGGCSSLCQPWVKTTHCQKHIFPRAGFVFLPAGSLLILIFKNKKWSSAVAIGPCLRGKATPTATPLVNNNLSYRWASSITFWNRHCEWAERMLPRCWEVPQPQQQLRVHLPPLSSLPLPMIRNQPHLLGDWIRRENWLR